MSRITMYPAINNSPQTSLAANLTAAATTITLLDATVLPDAPNLCTIGTGEDAEVVLYNAKSGNVLSSCVRGYHGTTKKAWSAMTAVYRGFTAYDHDSFKQNIDQMYLKVEVDSLFATLFSGGQSYYEAMRGFFNANGCAVMTDLTEVVDRWYMLGRTGWTGGTKFPLTGLASGSTGTKVGDNAGLTCVPSTNTVAGQDDYKLLPLFAVVDCNWYLDENGKKHITAIDGIGSANSFTRTDPTRPVGVLQMTPWIKVEEDDEGYTEWITDAAGVAGYQPVAEAVDLDGEIHFFVLHSKYAMGDDYSSVSGVPLRVWNVSHNSQITAIRNKWSNVYCGRTSADDAWMKLMTHIKYASLTLDNIMNGCCSYYNNNVHPAVAEENATRIIVTVAQGNALVVGSTICVGTTSYGNSQNSLIDRKKIISIEDVTIDGTAYKAVNLDMETGVSITTDLFWTTMQWYAGSCDNVLGNDGSPYSNTSSKEPYKLQGIEQSYGCYEVIGDCILKYEANEEEGTDLCIYVCRDATKITTSASSNYEKVGYSAPATKTADGWDYIKRLGFDPDHPEVWFGKELGGSSSTYIMDGFYIKKAGTTGSYEWRALGHLSHGLTCTGLSCAYANNGLSLASWTIGGRLSANGSRGEFAA